MISLIILFTLSTNSLCSQNSLENVLIITDSNSNEELSDIVRFINEQGGNIIHIFPPNVIQGVIDERLVKILVGENIARVIANTSYKDYSKTQRVYPC